MFHLIMRQTNRAGVRSAGGAGASFGSPRVTKVLVCCMQASNFGCGVVWWCFVA
jgi:hypothetical protein